MILVRSSGIPIGLIAGEKSADEGLTPVGKKVSHARKKYPDHVHVNYIAWKRVVELEGPQGLRLIKGFHDEALQGQWLGFRSSRLSLKWRVIYKVEKERCLVYVVEIDPHRYSRRRHEKNQ